VSFFLEGRVKFWCHPSVKVGVLIGSPPPFREQKFGATLQGERLKIWCHPPVLKDSKIIIVNNIKTLTKT
jgi:hypothetical protein